MAERWQCQRPLWWWSLAVGVAAALKWYFSAAATADLAWMLRPLALLVQALSGWQFTPTAAGEWQSENAGIVLVKACAGINFMILSFLGWCRPLQGGSPRSWPFRLAAALVCAWWCALAVNSLRILAVVHLQPTLARLMPAGDAHRWIGLALYLPALSAQFIFTDRQHWRRALLLGCGCYAALMLGVPLLTGYAGDHPTAYARHALPLLGMLLLMAGTAARRPKNRLRC